MKKVIALLLVSACCLSLCACGSTPTTNIEETTTELTVVEKIQQVESVSELAEYWMDEYPDENQKIAINEKWKEFFAESITGYYYNRERITPNLAYQIKEGKDFDLEDDRAVYMKSEEEIYFMPFSEKVMKDKGIKLEDIPTLENSNKYCYRIIEYDDVYDGFRVVLKNKYFENDDVADSFKQLRVDYDVEDDCWVFAGAFADETEEDGLYTKARELSGGTYYNNEETALAVKKAYEDEKAAEEQADKNLKNSMPRVGMTAAQVRKSKWGYPDKVNKDTYGDRVEEQWVYSSYGYVYLTNGVVTAIQER